MPSCLALSALAVFVGDGWTLSASAPDGRLDLQVDIGDGYEVLGASDLPCPAVGRRPEYLMSIDLSPAVEHAVRDHLDRHDPPQAAIWSAEAVVREAERAFERATREATMCAARISWAIEQCGLPASDWALRTLAAVWSHGGGLTDLAHSTDDPLTLSFLATTPLDQGYVFSAVCANPATPEVVLLAFLSEANSYDLRYIVLNPAAGEGTRLAALDAYREMVERYCAENDLEIDPEEDLFPLADDPARWAARDPDQYPAVLARCAVFPAAGARGAAAQHPNTPMQVVLDLAKDPVLWVAKQVARLPSAPEEALLALARRTTDRLTCIALATHPNATKVLHAVLAESQHPGVRVKVAEHSSSRKLVVQLLDDDVARVRAAARRRLRDQTSDLRD